MTETLDIKITKPEEYHSRLHETLDFNNFTIWANLPPTTC